MRLNTALYVLLNVDCIKVAEDCVQALGETNKRWEHRIIHVKETRIELGLATSACSRQFKVLRTETIREQLSDARFLHPTECNSRLTL